MDVGIGTEAAQFPEEEYINGIFVVVCRDPLSRRERDPVRVIMAMKPNDISRHAQAIV